MGHVTSRGGRWCVGGGGGEDSPPFSLISTSPCSLCCELPLYPCYGPTQDIHKTFTSDEAQSRGKRAIISFPRRLASVGRPPCLCLLITRRLRGGQVLGRNACVPSQTIGMLSSAEGQVTAGDWVCGCFVLPVTHSFLLLLPFLVVPHPYLLFGN